MLRLTWQLLLANILFDRRSSNGRTAGSGPANRGSNPCLRANERQRVFARCLSFESKLWDSNGQELCVAEMSGKLPVASFQLPLE